MILIPSGVTVHIALGVTDMRKGLDGLPWLSRECWSRTRSRGTCSPALAKESTAPNSTQIKS